MFFRSLFELPEGNGTMAESLWLIVFANQFPLWFSWRCDVWAEVCVYGFLSALTGVQIHTSPALKLHKTTSKQSLLLGINPYFISLWLLSNHFSITHNEGLRIIKPLSYFHLYMMKRRQHCQSENCHWQSDCRYKSVTTLSRGSLQRQSVSDM